MRHERRGQDVVALGGQLDGDVDVLGDDVAGRGQGFGGGARPGHVVVAVAIALGDRRPRVAARLALARGVRRTAGWCPSCPGAARRRPCRDAAAPSRCASPTGTLMSGTRMPATSLPSASSAETKLGYGSPICSRQRGRCRCRCRARGRAAAASAAAPDRAAPCPGTLANCSSAASRVTAVPSARRGNALGGGSTPSDDPAVEVDQERAHRRCCRRPC